MYCISNKSYIFAVHFLRISVMNKVEDGYFDKKNIYSIISFNLNLAVLFHKEMMRQIFHVNGCITTYLIRMCYIYTIDVDVCCHRYLVKRFARPRLRIMVQQRLRLSCIRPVIIYPNKPNRYPSRPRQRERNARCTS